MTAQQLHFYIGTQQDGADGGVHNGLLDPATGEMTLIGLAAEVRRPTWLEIDPRNNRLFAVSEIGNKGESEGEALSFGIDEADASLHPLGRTSACGGGTTHLCLSPAGDTLFAANFGGGQAARIAISPDGGLADAQPSAQHEGSGPHPRQNKPHPHGVTLSPDGRFLLVPDMGNDQIVIHALTDDGFAAASPAICPFPTGSGPRLVLFGRSGSHAYLLSELSAEMFVLAWDSEAGKLDIVSHQPLDLPDADGAPSAAALLMSPDGRHLYASNRRSGTLCIFAIDSESGSLSLIQSVDCGGEKPWGAGLSADGNWLLVANQASDNVVAFHRDNATGALTRAKGGPISISAPSHIAFAP